MGITPEVSHRDDAENAVDGGLTMARRNLAGKRILVVEDEFFLADDLCRELQAIGAVVIGPVPTVQEALALAAVTPTLDAAVLDINLGGEMVFPVADKLMASSVPFVFTSGYDDTVGDKRFSQAPRFQKPTEFRVILDALHTILPRPHDLPGHQQTDAS